MKGLREKFLSNLLISATIFIVSIILTTLTLGHVLPDKVQLITLPIVWILLCLGYFAYIVLTGKSYFNKMEKVYEDYVKEVENSLENGDIAVNLFSFSPIKAKDFVCTARLDENGEVVCKVTFDKEVRLKDVKEFCRNFTIINEI